MSSLKVFQSHKLMEICFAAITSAVFSVSYQTHTRPLGTIATSELCWTVLESVYRLDINLISRQRAAFYLYFLRIFKVLRFLVFSLKHAYFLRGHHLLSFYLFIFWPINLQRDLKNCDRAGIACNNKVRVRVEPRTSHFSPLRHQVSSTHGTGSFTQSFPLVWLLAKLKVMQ